DSRPIPGPARRHRTQRRSPHPHPERRQQRRPADPGRLALSLFRNQRRPDLRPRRQPWHAPEHSGRHRGALRTGPEPRGGTGGFGGASPGVRVCRAGDGRPV
ncbi:Urease beta subunit (EC 3.5.1.5), partial [Pseudomonas sp. FG-3G]